jgi:hypothetical protein
MSEVAHRAFALVPSESNFVGLTKRLVALRAEIDAILAELADQAMAMSHSQETVAAQPAPSLPPPAEDFAASADEEMLPSLSNLPRDDASEIEGSGMVEETQPAFDPSAEENETGDPIEPSEILTSATTEQPTAVQLAPEQDEPERDACDRVAPASDEPTPIAATDTEAAVLFVEAEITPPADALTEMSATEAASAEQQKEVAILDAPQQAAPETTAQPESADTGNGAQAFKPATEAEEELVDAAVISLHARQRKQKGGLAATPAIRTRSGRHVAAKIAAGIVVLLMATTLLVMADRNAFGSVPSLSWMSAPSSPTGVEWLLQRMRTWAVQWSDEAASKSHLPLDDSPLAGRMGWGS